MKKRIILMTSLVAALLLVQPFSISAEEEVVETPIEEIKPLEENTTETDVLEEAPIEGEEVVPTEEEEITPMTLEPEPISNLDDEGFVSLDKDKVITNEFHRNGYHYRVETKVSSHALNETNTIYNLTTGTKYTYIYSDGSGSTSDLKYRINGNTSYKRVIANSLINLVGMKIETVNGMQQLTKRIVDTQQGLQFDIITTVTSDGAIKHTINVKNVGTQPIVDFELLTLLDTELNGDDYIGLYSAGNNGIYMGIGDMTLYIQPVSTNTTTYAGNWHAANSIKPEQLENESHMTLVNGKALGTMLTHNVDSSAIMTTPTPTLAVGETTTFSYQEVVHTGNENRPTPDYTVHVRHIGPDGTILDQEYLTGNGGDSYTVQANTYEGLELDRVEGDETGVFALEGAVVTYYYKQKDVPAPVEPTPPTKPETPNKPTVNTVDTTNTMVWGIAMVIAAFSFVAFKEGKLRNKNI